MRHGNCLSSFCRYFYAVLMIRVSSMYYYVWEWELYDIQCMYVTEHIQYICIFHRHIFLHFTTNTEKWEAQIPKNVKNRDQGHWPTCENCCIFEFEYIVKWLNIQWDDWTRTYIHSTFPTENTIKRVTDMATRWDQNEWKLVQGFAFYESNGNWHFRIFNNNELQHSTWLEILGFHLWDIYIIYAYIYRSTVGLLSFQHFRIVLQFHFSASVCPASGKYAFHSSRIQQR